jgi:replicative DNA helicase
MLTFSSADTWLVLASCTATVVAVVVTAVLFGHYRAMVRDIVLLRTAIEQMQSIVISMYEAQVEVEAAAETLMNLEK